MKPEWTYEDLMIQGLFTNELSVVTKSTLCLIYIPIENTCVDSSVAVKFYSAMRLNSN